MTEMLVAEQLVGEARARRERRMDQRERRVTAVSAALFLSVAVAIAFQVPDERSADPLMIAGLLLGYAVLLHVRFEFGGYYASPEQLAYVPLLLLGPLHLLPLFIAFASAAAMAPDVVRDGWTTRRWLECFSDSWAYLGGVAVLILAAPGPLSVEELPIYGAALMAHFVTDAGWTLFRNGLLDHLPLRTVLSGYAGTGLVDAILTPLAVVMAFPAAEAPLSLLAIAPVICLFVVFSNDRRERYSKALELQRAYRGVVMLLSDVVEYDDDYTADHSRSVVELVNAVADELAVDTESRQELEFAAMLHDVGKIAIPKEILTKPAALTDDEFAVMRTHTIEGQFMLDRVGGLLGRVGEIVRSCHERWDGAGYPDGLKGEGIPVAARIVFVCDAYHAMTSDRVYRRAMPRRDALAELTSNAGTQFDPTVVDALVEVIEHGEPIRATAGDVRSILAQAPVRPSSRVSVTN